MWIKALPTERKITCTTFVEFNEVEVEVQVSANARLNDEEVQPGRVDNFVIFEDIEVLFEGANIYTQLDKYELARVEDALHEEHDNGEGYDEDEY
jgi:hypothetical protein